MRQVDNHCVLGGDMHFAVDSKKESWKYAIFSQQPFF